MSFVEYCKIERLGTPENDGIFNNPDDQIEITEKIDGANASFFIEDGIIHMCSHHRDLTHENDEKTFKKQRDATLAILETRRDKIREGWQYYCEFSARHTIKYSDDIPPAIGFDIRPMEGAFGRAPLFIGPQAREAAFAELGITLVPVLWKGKAGEFGNLNIEEFMKRKSAFGATKIEGIVIKNYGRMNVWGRQMFAKVVSDEFKETNRAVFGGVKKDNSDTLKLVEAFVTPARIRKRAQSLMDEAGMPLDRNLMKVLPIAVIKDVFKEETDAIVKHYKNIDLGTFKQLTAKKCLETIDTMMVEAMKEPKKIDYMCSRCGLPMAIHDGSDFCPPGTEEQGGRR